MNVIRRVLCAVLGGHAWQGPRAIDGRVRLVCGYGCGAMSVGVETRGQAQQARAKVIPMNLLVVRRAEKRTRVA